MFVVSERMITKVEFTHPVTSLIGDCAGAVPERGSWSQINLLQIGVGSDGGFYAGTIIVRSVDRILKEFSGMLLPDGSGGGTLIEEKTDGSVPSCVQQSSFQWSATRQ